MNTSALLRDGFSRVQELVHQNVDGASSALLTFRPTPDANSIGWLVWHLSRVQDDHVADGFGVEQVWTAQDFYGRFKLPFPVPAHGYGQSSADVAAVDVPAALLGEYYDAVQEQTVSQLSGVTDADLDRVVDAAWDPPVTLGVRLISVLSDCLQHIGQASYIAGLHSR